jgi:hypothetical protein
MLFQIDIHIRLVCIRWLHDDETPQNPTTTQKTNLLFNQISPADKTTIVDCLDFFLSLEESHSVCCCL